jgi:hypothetical protein
MSHITKIQKNNTQDERVNQGDEMTQNNMEELLEAANQFAWEGNTCELPADIVYECTKKKEAYYQMELNMRGVSDESDEFLRLAKNGVLVYERALKEQREKLLEMKKGLLLEAKKIYQLAIEAATTTAEMEECSKAIQLNLDDTKWADEVLKQSESITKSEYK